MNGFEILLKSIGFDPAVLAQTQAVFTGIADEVQRMAAQLDRIESNTMLLLEWQGDTSPAAPTNYGMMPVLRALPHMDHEPPAIEPPPVLRQAAA